MSKEQFLKQILILVAVIVASVVLIRSLTGGETLLEYAENNNIPVHSVEETNQEDTEQESIESDTPEQTE